MKGGAVLFFINRQICKWVLVICKSVLSLYRYHDDA
nr:MAG TPA: hypothetical protein [Caudoviricetes sp.]